MKKEEVIRKIEEMGYDLNYRINSGKGTPTQKECWEYAREEVRLILMMVRKIDNGE